MENAFQGLKGALFSGSVLVTPDIAEFENDAKKLKTSSEQLFCRQKHIVNERGPRRMARLVKADKQKCLTAWER